jgi:putative tributyrin esterase
MDAGLDHHPERSDDMILTEVNFFSETLVLGCTMLVLLPQRPLVDVQKKPQNKFRTLYLLHGRSDDHAAWQRKTSIERYVEGLNLAVVMPAVHRSFYTDMVHGGKYWQFISEEVPAVVHSLFPLSSARKDNFVAGLSMGGYGAFKLALRHPERFAAAASLSGGLDLGYTVWADNPRNDESRLAELRTIFGDLSKVPGSEHDLIALAKKVSRGPVKPRLYQCCGTEDFIYPDNVRFREAVRKLPLDLTYEEGPGEHNWAYWDTMIQRVLGWMFPHVKKS